MGVQIRALGPLVVEVSPGDVRPVRGKTGRVLATLVGAPGVVVSADRLIDAVWGDAPPRSAKNALQVYVSQLRTLLAAADGEAPELITDGAGYRLTAKPDQLDTILVETLAARARITQDNAERADRWSEVVGMWRGRAFEPWDTDEDLRPQAVRLEEMRLAAEEERCAAVLEAGGHREIIDDARRLADEQPLRERRWGQLMLALYRDGRQAEALRTYQHVRTLLGEELGIEPGAELRLLEERILLQDPALSWEATDRPPTSNVPAPIGPIIGRSEEIEAIRRIFTAGSRVATICGPGGVGKTRLAVEAGRDDATTSRFERIVYVALEGLAAADEVETALLQAATGVGDATGALEDAFADRRVLVVLDNCEHVMAGVRPIVERLVVKAANTTVLATSRVPLGIIGEAKLALTPLREAATDLFRLRATEAGHALPEDADEHIAGLCAALDGLPLAIELAAARLSILPLPELVRRASDPSLLEAGAGRPDRHRSAHDTIAWSYELLDGNQRRAFAALSVFRGGFSVEAAERVVAAVGVGRPLTVISALHDASLVVREQGRLRMLEIVRRFAAQKCEDARLLCPALDAMTTWLSERIVGATSRLGGRDNMAAIHALDRERGNIGVALTHLESADEPRFVAVVTRLAEYWWRTGDLRTGDEWIARAVESPSSGPRLLRYAAMFLSRVRPDADADPLLARLGEMRSLVDGATAMAHISWSRGDMVAARSLFEEAAAAQRETHDAEVIDTLVTLARMRLAEGDTPGALALADELAVLGRAGQRADAVPLAAHVRGLTAAFDGDFAAAAPHLAAARSGFDELGMERQLIGALRGVGMAEAHVGSTEEARRLVTESVDRAIKVGDKSAVGFGRMVLGLLAAESRDPEVAAGLLDRALRQGVVERDDQLVAWCVYASAEMATIEGDPERGAALLAASDRIVDHWRRGAPSATWRPERPLRERLAAALGEAVLAEATARGAALDRDAAVELGLGYPIGWVTGPVPRR